MIATISTHKPVMLEEAIRHLVWKPDGLYVDGTFGGGGHTRAILERFPETRVVAIDRDLLAIERGKDLQREVGPDRLIVQHGTFSDLGQILDAIGVKNIDGILLDLGMSSFQLDDPDRGFAFRLDGRLDMRFDQEQGESVADLLLRLDQEGIADIIWRYGEERRSRQIARAIVESRDQIPIQTTAQLAELVERVLGRKTGRGHPATRTFQALRIAVNDELAAIAKVLETAVVRLTVGGRIVVISFHSLEDRIVKSFIAAQSATCICPPEQIICTCNTVPALRRIGSSRKPTAHEQEENSRSRSAIMRVAERLAPPDREAA